MPTESKGVFDANIQRAQHFLKIHQDAQKGKGAPTLPYRELPRASVVFAVGAIDAYLSDMSAEVLISQFQSAPPAQPMRDILKRIQSDLPTLAIELSVLSTNHERIARLRETVADHFHNRVSQHGSKAVAATLSRIGADVADVWTHLESRGYSKPAKNLDEWTDKRHTIVHQGKKPIIHRPTAQEFIDFSKELIARVDSLAESVQSAT
jgi:hypothetical protein